MAESRHGEIQRAIMARGDDGVWDILLGAVLVTVGLVELFAGHALWIAIALLVFPIAATAKQLITAPRVRDFETRQGPSCSMGTAVGILLAAVVLVAMMTGLLFWLKMTGQMSAWVAEMLPIIMPITLAAIAVIVMITIGTMLESAVRYSFYAAALAAAFLALLWDTTPGWTVFVGPGTLMMVVGLACAARFTRSRPLIPHESRLRYRF